MSAQQVKNKDLYPFTRPHTPPSAAQTVWLALAGNDGRSFTPPLPQTECSTRSTHTSALYIVGRLFFSDIYWRGWLAAADDCILRRTETHPHRCVIAPTSENIRVSRAGCHGCFSCLQEEATHIQQQQQARVYAGRTCFWRMYSESRRLIRFLFFQRHQEMDPSANPQMEKKQKKKKN